jgi:hypothetical protein
VFSSLSLPNLIKTNVHQVFSKYEMFEVAMKFEEKIEELNQDIEKER